MKPRAAFTLSLSLPGLVAINFSAYPMVRAAEVKRETRPADPKAAAVKPSKAAKEPAQSKAPATRKVHAESGVELSDETLASLRIPNGSGQARYIVDDEQFVTTAAPYVLIPAAGMEAPAQSLMEAMKKKNFASIVVRYATRNVERMATLDLLDASCTALTLTDIATSEDFLTYPRAKPLTNSGCAVESLMLENLSVSPSQGDLTLPYLDAVKTYVAAHTPKNEVTQ